MLTELLPVAGLHLDPANARKHSSRNLEAVKASLARFGQQKPIVIDKDNIVRAGNGTLEAAKALGWEEISIVRSELIGPEMTAFAIADNRTAELAEWDMEALAKTLKALPRELASEGTGFSASEAVEMFDALKMPEGEDSVYTLKVESPVYAPTGVCPEVMELVDTSKAEAIQARIEEAEKDERLPAEVASFLRAAATRHYRFNYEQIAEFYSHAPEDIQALFEGSALVIVDFDQAIEHGWVRVCERLCSLAGIALKENASG